MVTANLSSIINSSLLKKRINSEHLSVFLESQGLHTYRNRSLDYKLNYLLEEINTEETSSSLDLETSLSDNFIKFLSDEVKYTNNRIVVTTPISISTTSPLSTTEKFKEEFPDFKNYNNIASISDNELEDIYIENKKKYISFYDKKITDNNQIILISKGFVKKKKQLIRPEDSEPFRKSHLDFVWVDVFPQEGYYRIHLSNPLHTTEGQLLFSEVYDYFSEMIEDLFNLIPVSNSAEYVLYKMYKSLTDDAENPYVEKVKEFHPKIDSFVDEISQDIGYSDDSVDSIDLNIRLKKLLERAIIQQDFKEYITTTAERAGFADKFIFEDPSGGKVQASANDHTYDVSKHEIYYDTKETIDSKRMLKALWVRWFKNEADKVNRIKVKYEVEDRYYITHFLFADVNKEVCNYVLRKFEEYKNKQLD